jgi:hypothetical protein
LAIYLGLAIGVNVLHHSCGGTTDANFAPVTQEDPCGCADLMDPADRCCTVDLATFQLDDGQLASAVAPKVTLEASHVVYPFVDKAPAIEPALVSLTQADSPPPRAVPATILFCSFLN